MSETQDSQNRVRRKGGAPGDKMAREEFGATQNGIVRAIQASTLQCREGSIYGNPWPAASDPEVEVLVAVK